MRPYEDGRASGAQEPQVNRTPPIYESVYTQTAEMIRHYDRLKYTAWTVYTAIIAALYVAMSAKKINTYQMIVVTIISSIYFVLLVFRIQRNYKVFYAAITRLELFFFEVYEKDIKKIFEKKPTRLFPFLTVEDLVSKDFFKINRLDKVLGGIPYFWLKVGFFILTPVVLFGLFYWNGAEF